MAMSKKPKLAGKLTSVFAKITALVVICGAIYGAALTVLSIEAQHTRTEQATRDKAQEITPMIARQIAGAVRFEKRPPANSLLEAVIDDSHGQSLGAIAITADGAEFASHSDGANLEALTELARKSLASGGPETSTDGFSYAIPIYAAENSPAVGALATQWTPAIGIAQGNADMLRTVLITAAIFLVCILGVAWAIYAVIARPLTRVNVAMTKVAGADYATEIPERKRRDEIGAIANSLEDFRHSLAQSQEANFQALLRGSALEASSAPLMLCNNDRQILYCNPAMIRFFEDHIDDMRAQSPNFDPQNLIGLCADEIVDLGEPKVHQTGAHGAHQKQFETRVGLATITVDVGPVLDENQEPVAMVAEWRDITVDQRNATVIGAIDASQLRAEFSPDGTLNFANAPFCALFGKEESALRGLNFNTAVCKQGSKDPILAATAAGVEYVGKATITAADGRVFTLDGAFGPIKDTAGRVQQILLLARDITEIETREQAHKAQREASESAQREVVDALRNALGALSRGDLTTVIEQTFAPEYEQLRDDFNKAMATLLTAMRGVLDNADTIRNEAHEISGASDDLLKRTEKQAATLEETAAALNQLTISVQSAAEVAVQANEMVAKAKTNAETSGAVVREAVQAMGEIEESSGKISKITSVIDEIAFQTNLLALNAGVEAARAGEAGRGFAVVASEVRALAQRSSDAAREIAGLISSSSNQVKRGVGLVGQAGEALRGIEGSVGDISTYVSDIAVSAHEQSSGLAEINTAVNHLDQVTQQNAAMFEETTAASHSLTREAQSLNETMALFTLTAGDAAHATAAFEAAKAEAPKAEAERPASIRSNRAPDAKIAAGPTRSPASAPARHSGSLAVKPAPEADDWEDF